MAWCRSEASRCSSGSGRFLAQRLLSTWDQLRNPTLAVFSGNSAASTNSATSLWNFVVNFERRRFTSPAATHHRPTLLDDRGRRV